MFFIVFGKFCNSCSVIVILLKCWMLKESFQGFEEKDKI